MALPLILLVAAAAAQAPGPVTVDSRPFRGRAFVSPMGEPFFGRQPGEDGLVVWFQQADLNRDGFLTGAELAQDAQRFFLTLDTNHDGEIDPDEITHYEEVIAPHSGGGGNWTGSEGVGEEASAGRYGLLQIPEPVISADSDFNRGVSAAEFRQAALARFQLLDTNRTGRLTLPQLEGIRQAAESASRRPPPRPSDEEGHSPAPGMGDTPPMQFGG